MAATPSVGWITSPVPLTSSRLSRSTAIIIASRRRKAAVHAPILGQFGGGTRHTALEILQLGLEAFQQGEGVGGGAGEAAQDLAVVQPANLVGVAFHDDGPERHLAVAADGDLALMPNGQDCGRAEFRQLLSPFPGCPAGRIMNWMGGRPRHPTFDTF